MAFVVPDSIRSVLTSVLELDANAYRELVEAVGAAGPDFRDVRKALRPAVPGQRADIALISLATYRVREGISPRVMARDVAHDLGVQDGNDLASILGNPNLVIASKSFSQSESFGAIFRDVRILTDMRPIFAEETEESKAVGTGLSVAAAQIFHSVVLDYESDAEDRAFYLTMDDVDLKALRKQINRALKKSRAVRKLIESANTPVVGFSLAGEDE